MSNTRSSYTMVEMKNILEYIKSKDAYSEVKGRRFWTQYADSGKTTRTWQSLKETFIKRILPDIGNPYYGLLHCERRKFTIGANSSIPNLSKVKWIRKPNDSGPEVSNHRPKPSPAKVKEPKDRPQSVVSSVVSLDADSDTDIDLVSIRAKAFSPIQMDTIIDSSSNTSITPITPNCEIIEPVISPFLIDLSPNIKDLNTEDAVPKDAPLIASPDMEAQSSESFTPNILKNSYLLLNSDDTDISFSPAPMEETSQRKGNLFGFSTGKPTILPFNSQNRKENTCNSESQYRKEFQPSCSKNMVFSTPTKRSNESLKRLRPPIEESSTDPQSDDSDDSDNQFTPFRSEETVSGTKKGQKMFCSLNGNLVQLYQSKHRKCSERQKIYTRYEDVCKHNSPKKMQKSVYIDEPAKSPVRHSQALLRNGNHEMIADVIARNNGGQPDVLNYWKLKYIAEKKRVNDLFRILASERKHMLEPELMENQDHNSRGNLQPKRAKSSHELPNVNNATQNTQLSEMSSSSINNNAVAPSGAKCTSNKNVKEKNDLLIVQHSKNDTDQNLRKYERDSNVILIDTQKADVLFELLRKLTETGVTPDNGKNYKTNISSPAKTSEAAQSSQDNGESIAKGDKTLNVVDTETYVFRSALSKAKLSNLGNTKNEQTEQNNSLANEVKKSEKEEIDELFSLQENKDTSIVIDETPEDGKVVLKIREKEKQIFDKILSEGSQEEENPDRCIFTDHEVKMLQSENSPKSDSGKTNENTNTVPLNKSGQQKKINLQLINKKVQAEENHLHSRPHLNPQPNEDGTVAGNTNLQSGIARRSLRTPKEGAGTFSAERNTNLQSEANLQSGIAKYKLRTKSKEAARTPPVDDNANVPSGIARRSLRTLKEGAGTLSAERNTNSLSEANLQSGIAKCILRTPKDDSNTSLEESNASSQSGIPKYKLRTKPKEAARTPPVDNDANLPSGIIAERVFRSQQKKDTGTPSPADKVKASPARGEQSKTFSKKPRKVQEDSTSTIQKKTKVIDEEKDLFKINPKFFKQLFPEEVSQKPSKNASDVVPSSSDSEIETCRYQIPSAFTNLKRHKGKQSESKMVNLKSFTKETAVNTTPNFNSKYPSIDKYYKFKHPPTHCTSFAHNDPGEKENKVGTTSQRFDECRDSLHLRKELENKYEQYSTTETIIQNSYLESEEIPFQPNLFYFIRKSKKTYNLTKAYLNHTLEQEHGNRTDLDFTLPLMEQDINFGAHKKNSVMPLTIEKASCETIVIDVMGNDSPIQKVVESFESDILKQHCQNIDTFQELPLTESLAPCSDIFLSCHSPNTIEKKLNLIDNSSHGSISKLLSEDDFLDPITDFSFNSKVATTLFDGQNSISQNQSMKSILSHLDAEFELEKLHNPGSQMFSNDVANVVGDIKNDNPVSPVTAHSSNTSGKTVDLEEWKHIMTEDESE